jgi:transposase
MAQKNFGKALTLQQARAACQVLRKNGFSIAKVQAILKKSRSFVVKWSNLERTEDAERSGRPKKTDKKQEVKVAKYLKQKAYGSLSSVQNKLKSENLSLSIDTIRNIAIRQQLVYKIKTPKPVLTDLQKEKRLLFVKEFLKPEHAGLYRKMLFYDECCIW